MDHLALWCPKYPKWKGNLINMYLNTNKEEKNHESDKDDQSEKPIQNKVFVYCDEVLEKKIYQSSEDEDILNMKTKLIR
jgi:hypothetical protein